MRTPLRRPLLLALALVALAVAPALARASTAARTAITNTATVNYNDAAGHAQDAVTASATVTVTLVPSAPLLSSPVATSVAQGQSVTLTYTVTGTANGPDTYTVASTATPTNASAVTPTPPANFTLGGTTLAAPAAAGATTITVPYDGDPANTSINGLAPGNTIVIGGNPYVIAAGGIAKNSAANTATITLTGAITGATVAAGTIVGQQTTFDVSVPSGNVTSGASGSQSVSTRVTSTTNGTVSTTQTTATAVTVNRPSLTVAKLVSVDNGATYAASASAPPNTSLIYRIVVTNGGSTNASAVVISDTLPLFLTYVAGSARTASLATTAYADATALTDNAGGFTVSGSSLSYAAGTVGTGASNVLVLYFRATIN
jgi:uncharacterized repeat protein (TIGR01451 family)